MVNASADSLLSPSNPPAIVTTQGSVEDWTIQNRTLENHEFHLHQTHFLVLSQNNFEINGSRLDTTREPFAMITLNIAEEIIAPVNKISRMNGGFAAALLASYSTNGDDGCHFRWCFEKPRATEGLSLERRR